MCASWYYVYQRVFLKYAREIFYIFIFFHEYFPTSEKLFGTHNTMMHTLLLYYNIFFPLNQC